MPVTGPRQAEAAILDLHRVSVDPAPSNVGGVLAAGVPDRYDVSCLSALRHLPTVGAPGCNGVGQFVQVLPLGVYLEHMHGEGAPGNGRLGMRQQAQHPLDAD
jgi:hypothetical protein